LALRPIKLVKLAIVGAGISSLVYLYTSTWGLPSSARQVPVLVTFFSAIALYVAADWYDNRERRRRTLERLESLEFAPESAEAALLDLHYTARKNEHSF
jgi:hypothetical protein